jgi:uncharacterized membrane protein YeaQ/YmgE (transglycosylase-associated protein family)
MPQFICATFIPRKLRYSAAPSQVSNFEQFPPRPEAYSFCRTLSKVSREASFRSPLSSEGKRWRKSMFHLIWYVLIGLISGVIAKSVMHEHMTIFWTIVLGIVGSIIGGAVTQMFSRPKNERYHPAGIIFSTLGAILILFICYKLKIHLPQINPF